MASNLDPFYRALVPRIQEDIAQRMASLANGSATQIVNSPVSTAERYAAEISYIKAMNDVLGICDEIDALIYGSKKSEVDENQG